MQAHLPVNSAGSSGSQPIRAADNPRRKTADAEWLDLNALAEITIVAGARRVGGRVGAWSADWTGEQLIELRFHKPTSVSRLRMVSAEAEQSRTQEITIWASWHRGERHREVKRQQFRFSPTGATEEIADWDLQLVDVSTLHVRIVPSTDGQPSVVHVSELRIAAMSQASRAKRKSHMTDHINEDAISEWDDDGGASRTEGPEPTRERRQSKQQRLDTTHESNVRGEHRYDDAHQTVAEQEARSDRDELKRRLGGLGPRRR